MTSSHAPAAEIDEKYFGAAALGAIVQEPFASQVD
jgi:hypothetical protein